MTAGSTKLIWSWSQRMRSASPTERNYPNAEIVMHENEPGYWFDDEKCKGRQPGAEIVLAAASNSRTGKEHMLADARAGRSTTFDPKTTVSFVNLLRKLIEIAKAQ
jgi:hypothetical protein